MSDKPRHNQDDVQEDLIEQIISQGLNRQKASPQEEAPADETPPAPEEKAKEKASSREKRNKRSSAYIYLLILFGAAFFMLLLAYFIQQRNSESAMSDLRNTMNLSREELMDQIKVLEKEKEQLNAAIQEGEIALEQEKQQRITAEILAEEYFDEGSRRFLGLERATTLAWLERFCAEGDWLMAAAVVEADDFYFNEKNSDYARNWADGREATPVQAAWYLALREEVFDNAGCMTVQEEESPAESSIAFTERPYIDPTSGRYDAETVNTAKNLWVIISSYSADLANDIPSAFSFVMEKVMEFYTGGDMERLNSGAFQPFTVELFAQITQDLIDQGLLKENEDGTLSLRTVVAITDVGIEDGQWIS